MWPLGDSLPKNGKFQEGGKKMNCFYHPHVASVGSCAQCGKSCCRKCLVDGRQEGTFCFVCVNEALSKSFSGAKKRIKRSFIFTAVVGIIPFFVFIASQSLAGILLAILCVYEAWALYYGWGPVYRKWKQFASGIWFFGTIPGLLITYTMVYVILLMIAQVYGVFGGAINQFRKDLQTVAEGQQMVAVQ